MRNPMVARSYEEAQAERAVELVEGSYDDLEAMVWRLAELMSKDGGYALMPLYQRAKAEFDALQERRAIIEEARRIAAGPKPKALSKRSSRARRAVG